MTLAINKTDKKYNRKVTFGCSLVAILFTLVTLWFINLLVTQLRDQAHYPGATPVTDHSKLGNRLSSLKWDDSYITEDEFPDVYGWYSNTFDMGPEARANEACIALEKTTTDWRVGRHMTVVLCETDKGVRIFVSRVMWVD